MQFNAPSGRVLCICFDNVGDLVFASCLTAALSRQNPPPEITLWCKEYTGAIGMLLPGVGSVVCSDPFWDKSPGLGRGRFVAFLKVFLKVRSQRFEAIYVTGRGSWPSFFAWLIGAPRRVGFRHKRARIFLSDALRPMAKDKPVLAEILRLLPSAVRNHRPRYRLLTPSGGVRYAKPTVGLHPFAGSYKRCAPLDYWVRLAGELAALDYGVLWFGTTAELARLEESHPHTAADHLAAPYTHSGLFGVSQAMTGLSAFIGHDSGPLHLAGSLGIPVLGLYLPGEPKRTFPQGERRSMMLTRASPADLSYQDLIETTIRFLQA